MLEFVEMFKVPIKMLHPLLTTTQEGNERRMFSQVEELLPVISFGSK